MTFEERYAYNEGILRIIRENNEIVERQLVEDEKSLADLANRLEESKMFLKNFKKAH